ncbi:hypothetical protein D1007_19800 [Hordeum vulgare]|nr:hypothetical protein D1007_19800 [Hordeum vulgare]
MRWGILFARLSSDPIQPLFRCAYAQITRPVAHAAPACHERLQRPAPCFFKQGKPPRPRATRSASHGGTDTGGLVPGDHAGSSIITFLRQARMQPATLAGQLPTDTPRRAHPDSAPAENRCCLRAACLAETASRCICSWRHSSLQ